jgi:CheY-like chemotaxis protein
MGRMNIDETISSNLFQARILVVDDHPGVAITLARNISQLGSRLEVISATSGTEALERIGNNGVDLVITDMMMPDMNGLELIEKLRAHPAGRPTYTILITAYDVPGLRESARRLKVDETIIKPFRPERIRQVVGKALENMEQTKHTRKAVDERQPFKILIADDVADNISLLSRYMQNEGYVFISACNGVETLEKTRSEMPDLILLDVNMPEMDGFQVLQEIRTDPAIEHIPVIILTAARQGPMDMQSGLNMGADDYVTKPFDRRELFARIRTKLRAKEAEDILRRRYKELSVLPEIAKDLSARLDIHELTEIVLRRSVETLGALAGHIMIVDPENHLHKEFHIPTATVTANKTTLPPMDDLLVQIKENHQGVIIKNTQADPRWQTEENDPASSVIIAPMFGRLDLIGLLVLIHEKAGYFNSDHQLLLQAIASQAAIALENAQLYGNAAQTGQQTAAPLQVAADAVLIFNAENRLGFMNPAGKKLFAGHPVKTGQPLLRGQGCDPLIDLMEECRHAAAPKTGQIVWTDGCPYSALVTPLKDFGCTALLYKAAQPVN